MAKDDEPGRRVLRRRTRRRSQPTKFLRIRQLLCFQDVESRLKAGWSISKVADFIQRERNEYTDVTRDSLMKYLSSYRDNMANTELLQVRMPDRVEQWQQEAEEALDEVKELARLYRLQMERVELEMKNERQIKKLFKTTGQEVFYGAKILQMSAAIKMDYGLKKKATIEPAPSLNVLNVDASTTFGSEAVQEVVHDPAMRRKVLSLVERMAKLEHDKRRKATQNGDDPDFVEGKIIDAKLDE